MMGFRLVRVIAPCVAFATVGLVSAYWVSLRRVPPQPLNIREISTEVEHVRRLRSLFRSVAGDYSKLTITNREELANFYGGDESKSKDVWNSLIAYDAHPQVSPTRKK